MNLVFVTRWKSTKPRYGSWRGRRGEVKTRRRRGHEAHFLNISETHYVVSHGFEIGYGINILCRPWDRLQMMLRPVAQILNLLYRRFVTCIAIRQIQRARAGDRSAECNSAIRQSATLRYGISVTQTMVSSVCPGSRYFSRVSLLYLIIEAAAGCRREFSMK